MSVEPHAYLLERIGGDRIRIEVLVPAGKEPEHYQASPDRLAAMTRARAIFLTGMPFEETLVPKLRSLARDLEIVDLRVGIELRTLELHSHDASKQSATGHVHQVGCSHDGLDPHIWFAAGILKTQAETVRDTLLRLDPAGEADYRRNCDTLLAEIDATQKQLAEILAPHEGRTVYVFHPSYGYFCDEFKLRQTAIEFEGKSPKAQQIAALIEEVKKEGAAPVIFVQPEFNESPAVAVAEATEGRIVVHSSLERDVLQSMLQFARAFAENDQ